MKKIKYLPQIYRRVSWSSNYPYLYKQINFQVIGTLRKLLFYYFEIQIIAIIWFNVKHFLIDPLIILYAAHIVLLIVYMHVFIEKRAWTQFCESTRRTTLLTKLTACVYKGTGVGQLNISKVLKLLTFATHLGIFMSTYGAFYNILMFLCQTDNP